MYHTPVITIRCSHAEQLWYCVVELGCGRYVFTTHSRQDAVLFVTSYLQEPIHVR
jgi:hypothetical protein